MSNGYLARKISCDSYANTWVSLEAVQAVAQDGLRAHHIFKGAFGLYLEGFSEGM